VTELIHIVCPLCGLNRPLLKTGARARVEGKDLPFIKGRIRFDHVDLEQGLIIQIRERRTEGKGFPLVDGKTFGDMIGDPDYADLVSQMALQVERIRAFLPSSATSSKRLHQK